jgi:general secretion pathway protein A
VYLQYFGLSESPFSITPDPAFVYLSAAHRDALAHLLYGVGQGGASGFVQLTGEVGTGKTTLCRCLIEQVEDDTKIALILNPLMTPGELLATIGEELGIDVSDRLESNKALVDTLNSYLLEQHAAGNRVVVVIDEAQNLSPEALEQVRLLTNLETAKHKLLQMVLLGQPELRQLLQRENLRQLAQRITARYHLAPLNAEETAAYVNHRMKVAGSIHNPFRRSALKALFQRSQGIPRLINIIADRSLAGAYAKESPRVNASMIHRAANEVQPSEPRVRRNNWAWAVAAISAAVLLAVAGYFFSTGLPLHDPPSAQQVARDAGAPVANHAPPAAVSEKSIPSQTSGSEDELPQTVDQAEPSRASLAIGDTAGSNKALTKIAVPEGGLSEQWLLDEHRQSWKGLADLWDDPSGAKSIQAACDGASRTGYACIFEQGNFARIKRLGFPVLLILRKNEPTNLLLRGATAEGLLVGSDKEPLLVAQSEIERLWLGDFIVVWPQADDWPLEIRRGESGDAVDIVMEMARLAEKPWQGSGLFDAGFEAWLMAFQRQQGLDPDGIVGPNTLLYLMAPTISKPRLILADREGL